jgi:hypothetical protein
MRSATILAATMAVGALLAAASSAHAIAYTFTTIEVPGASTFTLALGISDAGQIVGGFGVSPVEHGFLDTGGTLTTIDVPGASGPLQEPRASTTRDRSSGSSPTARVSTASSTPAAASPD